MIYFWAIFVLAGLFISLTAVLITAEKALIDYGICKVDINDGEAELDVEGGGTLLDALYENEIFIPSACGGRGSCAKCKLDVLSGGGPVLPTETPYLTRGEIRGGTRLGCQVKIRENMKVRMPEEYLHVQLFRASVERAEMLTHDIRFLRFSLDEPEEIEFRAGQYVQVEAPSPEGPVYRAYSISNPEHEKNVVELIVRLVPDGIGSTYLHNIQEGDSVTFTGPFGEFQLNQDPEVEIVNVGGGCGMAPMRSIIYTVLSRWPQRSCRLFFGCRACRDVFYLDEMKRLEAEYPNFQAVYALSDMEEGDEWDGETGFIHLAVDKYLEEDRKRQGFLCGPPPMIEAVIDVFRKKGMVEGDWFYDEF